MAVKSLKYAKSSPEVIRLATSEAMLSFELGSFEVSASKAPLGLERHI
jgi:hypothetical protein